MGTPGTSSSSDAAGATVAALGDVHTPVFPRSSNKPLQAVGLLRAGLVLDSRSVALASASHSGEAMHLDVVREVLAGGGLDEDQLQCPPDLPLEDHARTAVLVAGGGPRRIYMNCSGKHAAMLRTCRLNGWSLADYLDPAHPLQRHLRDTVGELTGETVAATGIDGCGAPLFAISLTALARGFLRLATASEGPERVVADAMRAHPELVAGTGREATAVMRGVSGAVAKDGAEAVWAVAVPGIGAVAVKIDDGAQRASNPAMVAGLELLGVRAPALTALAETPILGGGAPVGSARVRAGVLGR